MGITIPEKLAESELKEIILERGKTWLCLQDEQLVGFGVVDMTAQTLWALMVEERSQEYECANKLHEILLDWYFAFEEEPISVAAAAGSSAEEFYLSQGWLRTGLLASQEMRFEMSLPTWKEIRRESVEE